MEIKTEECSRQPRIDFRSCKLCPYRTKSMLLLIGHLRLHRLRTFEDSFSCHSHPPQNYKCNKCSFEAEVKTTLQRHIDAAHCDRITPKSEESTYNCKGCRFETCSLLVFSRHFYSAANGGMCGLFMCYKKKCSYATTNRGYFQAHSILRHLQDEYANVWVAGKYKCGQCPFVVKKRSWFITHILMEHADPDDGFGCDRCSAKFLSRIQLEIHTDSVHDHLNMLQDKKDYYYCDVCTFRTTRKGNLQRHLFKVHRRNKRVILSKYCSSNVINIKMMK